MGWAAWRNGRWRRDDGRHVPRPEVDQNRATLKMFPGMDRGNIVAFLKTLSDGYFQR